MKKGNSASNLESLFGAKQGESLSTGHRLVARTSVAPDLGSPQPRTRFAAVELEGLASSIRALRDRGEGTGATGIIQSLVVRVATPTDIVLWREMISSPDCPVEYKSIVPDQISYILLAGERRWRAAGIAGQNNLPIVVTQTAVEGALLLQVIENDQRQDLSPLEKARAYARLRDENKLSIRDVAAAIGKTRGYVTNRLDLLKMGDDVQAMVSSREDTLKHAALIQGVTDPILRSFLILQVLESDASVAQIREQIPGEDGKLAEEKGEEPVLVSSREDTNTGGAAQNVPEELPLFYNLKRGIDSLRKVSSESEKGVVLDALEQQTFAHLLSSAEEILTQLRRIVVER